MAAKDDAEFISIRFRGTISLGDKTYPANTLAQVEATDEAWELVNTGKADLEPPPGTQIGDTRQPFPPESLTEAPAPEPVRMASTVPATPNTVGKDPHPTRASGTATAKTDAADELDALTVADLHEVAKAEGVSGYSTMHKDELVKAIKKGRKK